MRKLFFFLIAFTALNSLYAQQQTHSGHTHGLTHVALPSHMAASPNQHHISHLPNLNLRSTTCTALENIDLADDTPSVYFALTGSEGYLIGNGTIIQQGNDFPQLSFGEGFYASNAHSYVSSAQVYFGDAIIKRTDSAKIIKVYVYDNSGVGVLGEPTAPGVPVDSASATLKAIAANIAAGNPSTFTFSSQTIMPNGFYITVLLPTTTGDTLTVFTNTVTQAINEGTGNSWLYLGGLVGGWVSIDSLYGVPFGTYIVPTVCQNCPTINISIATTATTATATASGGVSPYLYIWSNGQFGATATGLVAGSKYGVSVEDNNGCLGVDSVTIPNSNCPTISVTATQVGSSLSATASASGGATPYTYSWNTSPAQNTPTATGLTGGHTYIVTATDHNGCTGTGSVTIVGGCPVINAYAHELTNGNEVGIVTSGGTAPYTYQWEYASTVVVTGDTVQESLFAQFGLPASTVYTLVVTDHNGCTDTAYFTHTAPGSCPTIAVSVSQTGVPVSATANVTGGTAPYTYAWSTNPQQTNQTATNLPTGSYNVTVTDHNGCTGLGTVSVSACPTISVTVTQVGTTLSATASASGGVGPYGYSWSTIPTQTTATATGLTAGTTYSVSVIDQNGCTGVGSVAIQAAGCPTITVSAAQLGSSTAAAATASGGVGPYTYVWSTNPTQTTATATGLTPGSSYVVTATDHNGCTGLGSVSIAPASCPTITVHASQVGTSTVATATASGGATPYTFVWSTNPTQTGNTATGLTVGSSYAVTVIDNNGCTGTSSVTISPASCPTINVSTTQYGSSAAYATATGGTAPYTYAWGTAQVQHSDTATQLATGGTYAVTAIDHNGCTGTGTITISATACPTINISVTELASGNLIANVSGGSAPYTYLWDFGSSTAFTDTVVAATFSPAAGQTYPLTVTDHNGCATTTHFVYGATACPTITVTAAQINTTTASASATGGTAPYTYYWSNAPTSASDSGTALSVGSTYTVTAIDHNGCTASATITISSGSCPTITATATQVGTTPSASAGVSGGVAPYTYRWNTNPVQTTDTATGLTVGTSYTVTVIDHNGCVGSATVTIIPSGIALLNGISDFNIYPNPSSGIFTASVKLETASDVTITVIDVTGSKIYESTDKAVTTLTRPISLGSVAAGVYIVNVRTAQGTANQRIIVK